MKIYDGQMIYNTGAQYNLTREVLRTKIMPRGPVAEVIEIQNGVKVAVDENGEIVATDKPATNWGPLALAAALAYFAMG